MEISSDENGDGNGNLPLERTNTAGLQGENDIEHDDDTKYQ